MLYREQLSNVIVKVKEEFGGCLHGQLFSNITKKAKFIAMHTYPDVARSMASIRFFLMHSKRFTPMYAQTNARRQAGGWLEVCI